MPCMLTHTKIFILNSIFSFMNLVKGYFISESVQWQLVIGKKESFIKLFFSEIWFINQTQIMKLSYIFKVVLLKHLFFFKEAMQLHSLKWYIDIQYLKHMEVELFNVPWSLPSIYPVFLSRNSRYFSVKSKHSVEYSGKCIIVY